MPETADHQDVGPDEVILRRIPPECPERGVPQQTDEIPGGRRATSPAIRARRDESGSSFTRLLITSPLELLNALRRQERSPEGWMVCRLHVSDVLAEGLRVIALPVLEDPGHCEIRPGAKPFTDKGWSRLARKSRILTDSEVARLRAGDRVDF